MGKLLAGEVNESQVIEASGDGGVVLDKGPAAGVLWEELVNPGIVTQQTTVGAERKAAEITPTRTHGGNIKPTVRHCQKDSSVLKCGA